MFYSRIIWLAAFALAGTPATAGENYAERQILPTITLGTNSEGFVRSMIEPATADLNGDGLQDVVFHIGDPLEATPIKILLNDGAGSLVDATSEMIAGPVPKNAGTRQFIIEDFNGDGQLDIFLDNTGTEEVSPFPGEINQLLLSGRDGKLRDMTAVKLPGLRVFSHGSSAADIDGDGDIDIWVNSGPVTENFAGPHLMLNDGTGGFTIVADLLMTPVDTVGPNGRLPEALVGISGSWAQFIDAENDGDFDLYLAGVDDHGSIRPWLLLNDGSGRFTDAGADAIPTRTFGNFTQVENSSVLDINGDGFDDLLLLESPIGNQAEGCTGGSIIRILVAVLISNGNGTFRDETFTRTPQTTDCHNGGDFDLGDIDGDGAFDILIQTFPETPSELLLNDGSGNFSFLPDNFVDVENGMGLFSQPVDINADGITDFLEAGQGFDQFALIKRNVPPTPLFATVRPRVLSAQVRSTVTAFATLTNAGATRVTGCTIRAAVTTPADFLFQTTDPATNEVIGTPNRRVALAPGAVRSFVIAFTPRRTFDAHRVPLTFDCADSAAAIRTAGNTLLLSAKPVPMPWLLLLDN